MTYDPNRHRRRSIRLRGYDYSSPGAYFITICTKNRECLFGDVVNGEMVLNAWGEIARQCWLEIPNHFPHAALDAFVIMPNHVHGIIILNDMDANRPDNFVGARHAVSPQQNVVSPQIEQFGKPTRGTIPTIIRSFKSATTKQINMHRNTPGAPVWQRNYYEHIIRNGDAMNRIRAYIMNNPAKWETDRNRRSR